MIPVVDTHAPVHALHARARSPRRYAAALLLGLSALTSAVQAQTPGRMEGRVTDARGVPLAGVQVIADNTIFYNTNAIGVSDAQGRYSLNVASPAGTWVGSARVTRQYNGRRYVLELDPNTVDAFAGNAGAIRDFTWKLSGDRRDGLGTYGMSVIYYFDLFEDPHYPGEYLDTRYVELSLRPVGPLIDGSTGQTLVGLGQNTPDGPAIRDVPVGRYAITARYRAPQRPVRPLVLRVRNAGNFVPELTADFEQVIETLYQIQLDVSFDTAHVFGSGFELQSQG